MMVSEKKRPLKLPKSSSFSKHKWKSNGKTWEELPLYNVASKLIKNYFKANPDQNLITKLFKTTLLPWNAVQTDNLALGSISSKSLWNIVSPSLYILDNKDVVMEIADVHTEDLIWDDHLWNTHADEYTIYIANVLFNCKRKQPLYNNDDGIMYIRSNVSRSKIKKGILFDGIIVTNVKCSTFYDLNATDKNNNIIPLPMKWLRLNNNGLPAINSYVKNILSVKKVTFLRKSGNPSPMISTRLKGYHFHDDESDAPFLIPDMYLDPEYGFYLK